MILLLALVACEVQDDGFGNAGSVPSGTDGTDGTVAGDCEAPNDGPSAPCLLDLSATYDEIENYGPVLDVSVTYTDPEDDLVGGRLDIEVTGGSLDGAEVSVSIDAKSDTAREAWVEGGAIRFVASVDSLTESYEVTVQAWDAAGNGSNVLTGTVSP